jgi:tRNA-dihydrouridine synthase
MRWRCRELTGCDTLMIGRGMVRNPGLALAIVAADRVARWRLAPGAAWHTMDRSAAADRPISGA